MGAVDTSLEFLADLSLYQREKPFLILPAQLSPPEKAHLLSNLVFHDQKVVINDLRGKQDQFSIAVSGFEIVHNHSDYLDFTNPISVAKYREETTSFLKRFLKADHVVSYDYVVRENRAYEGVQIDINDPSLIQTPPKGLHVDSTFESSPKIIELNLSEEERARYIKMGNRFQIVNTWRPLVPKVEERPIAVCDFRSIDPRDLLATARIFPHRMQELYYLRHNPDQRFYYMSKQTPEELLVMVQYDTMGAGNARYCPHVSFYDPLHTRGGPPRKSVETRSILVYEGGHLNK